MFFFIILLQNDITMHLTFKTFISFFYSFILNVIYLYSLVLKLVYILIIRILTVN